MVRFPTAPRGCRLMVRPRSSKPMMGVRFASPALRRDGRMVRPRLANPLFVGSIPTLDSTRSTGRRAHDLFVSAEPSHGLRSFASRFDSARRDHDLLLAGGAGADATNVGYGSSILPEEAAGMEQRWLAWLITRKADDSISSPASTARRREAGGRPHKPRREGSSPSAVTAHHACFAVWRRHRPTPRRAEFDPLGAYDDFGAEVLVALRRLIPIARSSSILTGPTTPPTQERSSWNRGHSCSTPG